jgi:hypothetical protein
LLYPEPWEIGLYPDHRRNQLSRRRTAVRALGLVLLFAVGSSCVQAARDEGLTIYLDPALPADLPLEATALAPISEEEALATNAAIPLSGRPDRGALPFRIDGASGEAKLRSLDCLTQAVYYEGRSESVAGQRAIAQVVLNRTRHRAYPGSVCGVVYQGAMRAGGGCQFTFTCDGSMRRRPHGKAWARARQIASEALGGHVAAAVGHATHYHTQQVFPVWAPRLIKSAVIGRHIFYRLPGRGGRPSTFRQDYAGQEPVPPAPVLSVPQGSSETALEAAVADVAIGAAPVASVIAEAAQGAGPIEPAALPLPVEPAQ